MSAVSLTFTRLPKSGCPKFVLCFRIPDDERSPETQKTHYSI